MIDKKAIIIYLLSTLLLLSFSASSAGVENPLSSLHEFLQVETFKGSFTQKVYDERNSLIGDSIGTVAIEKPGRFRWEYLQPSRQLIVSDGLNFITYDPELEQATVQPLIGGLGHAPIMLLLQKNPSFENFELELGERSNGLDWVILTPKVKDMEFTQVELGLEKGKLVEIRMHDHFEQLTIIKFTRTVFDTDISPETFHLYLPEETDIIGSYAVPTRKAGG